MIWKLSKKVIHFSEIKFGILSLVKRFIWAIHRKDVSIKKYQYDLFDDCITESFSEIGEVSIGWRQSEA